MIPYGHQTIDTKDIKAVTKVLRSDFITQGPKVREFEEKLSKHCGTKYAVAVSHGTAALHLAYLAAGIGKGDEVITSPNTFVATTNMLLAVGAKPVFCDIRMDTYNIDETKITSHISKKTKAIVPIHFAGHPSEMNVTRKIARKHNLIVITDACHALGARYRRKRIGSEADLVTLSFHPVKSITTGEGGAVLTNNKKYYEKLLLLRSHGVYKDKKGKNVMIDLGYNYRITDIQSALGVSQLKKLSTFIAKRHHVVRWYRKELSRVKDIILPVEQRGSYSAWHLYVIRLKKASLRDTLATYLKNKGIGVNFHYPAVYKHPYYKQHGYDKVHLKNEEAYEASCLTLPCYPGLTRAKVYAIGKHIERFILRYR